MRAGFLRSLLTTLSLTGETAAATGGDKYTRIITDTIVTFVTLSNRDVAVIDQLLTTDNGAHFKSADEVTEMCHNWEKQIVHIFRNVTAWTAKMRAQSVALPRHPKSKDAGNWKAPGRPVIVAESIEVDILVSVMNHLKQSGLARNRDSWTDAADIEHLTS